MGAPWWASSSESEPLLGSNEVAPQEVVLSPRMPQLQESPGRRKYDLEGSLSDHVTYEPPFVEMAAIVTVQALNSADWAVILPVAVDVSDYLGQGSWYASMLVSIMYVPFFASLGLFRWLTTKSYKYTYDLWSFVVVTGNLGYVAIMVLRPRGAAWLVLVARTMQGLGQCITFANKQVLALVTSYDVRNKHMATLGSGNIIGNAVGVMICSSVVEAVGKSVEVASTPVYLIVGALAVAMLAFIAGLAIHCLHPHELDVVPERYRVKKGGAKLNLGKNYSNLVRDDTVSRRIRILSTNALGFLRIMNRSAWQTASIYVLMQTYHYSMFVTCLIYSSIVVSATITQQWFGHVQSWTSDENWVRLSEVFAAVSTVAMFHFSFVPTLASSIQFIVASVVFYSAMSVNSNVTNINATKYAIESDPWFNQEAITTLQLILQNMLGKILGPLIGLYLYLAFGQNGFVILLVVVNLVSTLISEMTMPATMLNVDTCYAFAPDCM